MISKGAVRSLLVSGLIIINCLILNVAHGAMPVTIKDAAKRVFTFEKLPERIVVVGAAPFIPLHILYMFDETKDRLAGFEERVKKKDRFLSLLDPHLDKKTALSTNPGPESVAALKPDLVISKGTIESALTRSLKKIGIPVLYLGAETPKMFLKDIDTLGKVFGNPARAKEIIGYYNEKLSLIKLKTKNITPDQKERVLLLEYSNRGKNLTLKVPAQSWIQTQQVMISGGQPVWLDRFTSREGWQMSGFEQIAAWNPEKIFLVVWYQLKGRDVINSLYTDSKWSKLKAVQNKHLYLFPQDIYGWDSATPRWILGTLWLSMKTYPEQFGASESDFKSMVSQFFKTVYHMDETTINNHILPEISKNAGIL